MTKVNNLLNAIRHNLPEEHKYLADLLEEETPEFSIKVPSEVDVFRDYLNPQKIIISSRPVIPEITITHRGIEYLLISPVVVSYKTV